MQNLSLMKITFLPARRVPSAAREVRLLDCTATQRKLKLAISNPRQQSIRHSISLLSRTAALSPVGSPKRQSSSTAPPAEGCLVLTLTLPGVIGGLMARARDVPMNLHEMEGRAAG